MSHILKHPLLHAGHHEVGDGYGGNGGIGNRKISVKNIPMVEGKMSFDITTNENGECRSTLIVEEPLRHFEATCEGHTPEEIAIIVQRICGVCPYPYSLAAVKAYEKSVGHEVSEQTHRLRELCIYGSQFNSLVLHALDLVAPRLLKLPNIIAFAKANDENKALAAKLLSLHTLGNELSTLVAGRAVHATKVSPGYMTSVPKEEDLRAVREKLANAHEIYGTLVAVFAAISKASNPKFPPREREYIAVKGTTKYPFYGGLIGSTKREQPMTAAEFEQYKHEYVVDNSNSKQVSTDQSKSYMVGALARLHVNEKFICEEARKDMETLELTLPCYDPYMNTAAQLVEGRQILVDVVKAIDELLDLGIEKESRPHIAHKAGYGAGYLEAPRGMIWHEYRYGEDGLCVWANCIIPTGMNTGSMQEDLEHYAPYLIANGYTDAEIEYYLDLLLAHYDPCNSCAVHVVNINQKPKLRSVNKNAKIAVVSIGNALVGDDGVGITVVEELKRKKIRGNIEYLHGGVGGLDVFEELAGKELDAVIFVDAVDGIGDPGETIVFTGDELLKKAKKSGAKVSLHQSEFTYSFELAEAIGLKIPKIVRFVGVQAGQLEIGMGLSPDIDVAHVAAHVAAEVYDILGVEPAAGIHKH